MKYYKFAPGRGARFWQEMKEKGIASIGWGNYDYASTNDAQEIINLRPEYFANHNGSPSIIHRFNQVKVDDVIYAFRGLTTIIARGKVTSKSKYNDELLIDDPDGEGHYNYIEVEWKELENEITIKQAVHRNTIMNVTERHEEFENMINGKSESNVGTLNYISLNQILYGPPGTGKTFNTVSEALKFFSGTDLLEENDEEDYLGDKLQFDVLKLKGHIEFITFHQSFSYEDFVEGIRAETNVKGELSYSIKDGIFKKIAIEALFSKFVAEFSEEKINELWEEVKAKTTNTDFNSSNYEHKKLILSACTLADFKNAKGKGKPYVLIIDEINRGNTSRVFGELITLVETTKRAGTNEAMDAILPYSQETFTVPDNLYIIGTMNTADRSLALMDTALRRRFDFIEKMPQPELIKDINIEGIDLKLMLQTINDRIEALYDREHTIGHAFFMKLISGSKVSDLALIFKNNILPLLEEYFFEDWEKITIVLGKSNIYIKKTFDNLGFDYAGNNYSRNDSALENKDTYINIYKSNDINQAQAE